MPETKLLRIVWEGPYSLADVSKKSGDDDCGLYQIYAHHMVFGAGALVYVGKAQDQTFSARFAQHDHWLKDENDVSIRLGVLWREDYRTDDDWKEWAGLLADAERLTVFWHSPPYNCHYITGYSGQPLQIQNWRNRGSLLAEYSSHWKPLRPDDACEA
jgi:hypothetical protein